MESVRTETEGKDAQGPVDTSVVALKAPESKGANEFFPGEHQLDDDLMKKADQVQEEMQDLTDPTAPAPKKTAALTAQKQESRADRAARFFAMHGMKKVGHMLGEEMSKAAETKAVREEAEVDNTLRQQVATPEASADALEMPEDDDEDLEAKKRWQAVDALRRRAPRV